MAAVINMAEGTAPSTPAAGTHNLYVDGDGDWHILSDGGNDHTLMTTDTELATAGLADGAVTNAKMADMAESTIKGRAADAGTGAPVDLTATQVVTLLSAEIAVVMADQFAPAGDADWTTLTLESGYSTTTLYPTSISTWTAPGYRKMGGIVRLRGAAHNSSGGSTIGYLPAGYRPAYACGFAAFDGSTSGTTTVTRVTIEPDGAIKHGSISGHTIHLDGISFVPA